MPWGGVGLFTPLALAVPLLAGSRSTPSGRSSGLAAAPLGQIHAAVPALTQRLSSLIAAAKALVAANGNDHAAAQIIGKNDAALHKACPGAVS
jgi:hypothetical protein